MIYHILGHHGVQAYHIMAIMSLWLVGSRVVHESVRVGFVPNPLPNHFGSPKNGSAADSNSSGGRTSKFSDRAQIVRIASDFCRNLLIFAGSDRISKRSWLISTRLGRTWRDLGRSQHDQAQSRRDPTRSWRDQARSRQDLVGSYRSDKIIPMNYFNRRKKLFSMCFPMGSVEIGFPCSNPSTDPPVLDFGIEDPLQTVADVRSTGSRAGSARLGRWVGYRVRLDTPS